MSDQAVYRYLDSVREFTENREQFLSVVYKYILDTQSEESERKLVDLYAVYEVPNGPLSPQPSTSSSASTSNSEMQTDTYGPFQFNYQATLQSDRIECHSWFQSPNELQLRYALPEIDSDDDPITIRVRANALIIGITGKNGFYYKAVMTNACQCECIKYTVLDKKLHLFLEKSDLGIWPELFYMEIYQPVVQSQ